VNKISRLSLAWTKEPEILKKVNCIENKTKILFYTYFDDEVLEYSNSLTHENLKNWLEYHATPLIHDLDQELIKNLYNNKKTAFFLLYSDVDSFDAKNISALSDIFQPFENIAKEYRVNY